MAVEIPFCTHRGTHVYSLYPPGYMLLCCQFYLFPVANHPYFRDTFTVLTTVRGFRGAVLLVFTKISPLPTRWWCHV